tara:strand:+ start:29 stop:256 length:228 start_codon:yes stop_codon:yes gene_type:complete
MNGKQATRLRRLAEALSKGRPPVRYNLADARMGTHPRKKPRLFDRPFMAVVDPASTRGVYLRIKGQYLRALRNLA